MLTRRPMPIRNKLLLLIGLLVFATSGAFTVALYDTQRTSLLEGIDAKLLASATLARSMVPDDYHDRIDGPDAVSDGQFLAIVERYNRHCRELGLQYLWSVLVMGGKIVFTTATSTSKDVAKGDHAGFLDVHSNPAAFEGALASAQPHYSTFSNEWGEGRMVLVPHRDAHGRTYIYGASMDLGEVNRLVRITMTKALATAVVLLVLAGFATLFLARSLSSPIEALDRVAQGMRAGELNQEVDVRGSTEIASLSHSFGSMADAIRQQMQTVEASEEQVRDLNAQLQGRIEELRRLDHLKDEFLANTSHELRTPLAGIIGITETLLASAPTNGQLRSLHVLLSAAHRLASLVNDILDYSRLKHADLELHRSPVDLQVAVEVVMAAMRPLVGGKQLVLDNAIACDGVRVLADEDRLQQILYNLLGNAIKFTECGRVVVISRCHDGIVEVSVSDTGIGIAAEDLSRIFESFEQVDGSNERRFGGTGLGLSITKRLVELHGGQISVDSALREGTTFTFSLPQTDAVAEKSPRRLFHRVVEPVDLMTGAVIPALQVADEDGSSGVVLVADDEPLNLEVVAGHLRSRGYQVVTASDGATALALLEERSDIELAILDVMMPGTSGLAACEVIRKERGLLSLPIILMTAKTRIGDLVEGFASGANDYLAKPFSRVELLTRVKTQLALKRETDVARECTVELVESLQENRVLLQEVHHRVNNNLQTVLSLVALQMDGTQNGVAREALRDAHNRIAAIAEAHRQLQRSRSLSNVSLSEHVEGLLAKLARSHRDAALRVGLDWSVAELQMRIDRLVPLSLLLTECISNVYKHAFPDNRQGNLRVTIEAIDSDRCRLEVADDGVGFDVRGARSLDPLGLRMIERLTSQLDGEVSIYGDHGTLVVVGFRRGPYAVDEQVPA